MRGSGTQVGYKDVNWRYLKSLIPYLMEFKSRVLLAIICLVLAKAATVYLPFILKDIVDGLDVEQIISVPLGLLIAYGFVRLSTVVLGEIRDTLFGRVTERAMRRVGLKVFQHLHHLDVDFHLNRQTGGLARDIDRGTNGISFLMRFMVFNIIPTLLEIAFVIGILWIGYSIWFALIVFVAVASYIGYSIYATEIRTRFVRKMNEADSSTNTRAIDSLLNFETVKYFANEDFESKEYDKNLETWERAREKNRLSLFALNGGQAFIISFAMALAMILAAYQVKDGLMTIGDFVLINAFMMQIFLPLNFLGFVYREMKGSMANIERMFKLLETTPKITDADDATDLNITSATIQFESVYFGYSDDRQILRNLDLTIQAGEKVAIVGPSGSGKSTLTKLLLRFYDPNSGTVRINQHNIAQQTQQSLRRTIGIVPQDTVLFNQSILENIRYGNISATDEDVYRAIARAHLKQFIDDLPNGAQTMVGERGLKLSGGEKQRVAIARALVKNPSILIFDEATSSLDSKAERFIMKAIEEASKNRTTLIIAHRLSTIVNCDRIIVLKSGKIAEIGTHEELLNKNEIYKEMWSLQNKDIKNEVF